MSERVGGVLTLTAGDKQLEVTGSFSCSPRKKEREGVIGATGKGGYKETYLAPFFEGDIVHESVISPTEIEDMTDVTCTVDLANGQTYVYGHAWSTGAPTVNAIDGTLAVRFECRPVDLLFMPAPA